MYDTVHFYLVADSIEGGFTEEVIEQVYNALTSVVEGSNSITAERFFFGSLRNLKIRMSKSRLTVKGSLCKFVMGNQFDTMLPQDVRRGVGRLSKILGVPMDKAQISRLDIGKIIKTEHTPNQYWPYLSKLGRFVRLEQENGLYFRTSKCELCFYDKVKEMKRKGRGNDIPLRFRNSNLLRYELRFKSSIAKQFNMAFITGATLMEEAFFKRVEEEIEKRYYIIVKERDLDVAIEDVSCPKELQKYMEYAGILKLGGETKVRAMIDRGRKQGKWSYVQASRMRQHVKSVSEAPFSTKESPLIIELDKKMAKFT